MKRRVAAGMLLLGAVLAGCGFAGPGGGSSSPGSNNPAPSIAPCAALTRSDAASITGDTAVARITSGATVSSNQCLYIDINSATITSAEITIEQSPGAVDAQTMQNALATAARVSNGTYQSVSGIGDAAYSELGASEAGLIFAKGSTLFAIVASGAGSNSALLSAIEQYATTLAGRL
jgi:hypothetical protein